MIKPISNEQLLSQIRALNAELNSATINPSQNVKGPGFGELLQNSIASVAETQKSAQDLAVAYETGNTDVSLIEVMVKLQEADLSFRAVTEVRNKLISAYQEIMNMPV
jgi:flagellar hook-basal body complex protein FliE